ncbi:MAG: hypothetical protein ABI042_16215 [Verrucomicrobiota bacterium]
MSAAKPPVALVHIVDSAGNPISGAVISPEALRSKTGPYSSGWYVWSKRFVSVPNDPVATDETGRANIPYPKHVFERIETGVIILSVNHSNYVFERPELVVDTTPPSGAPWQVRIKYLLDIIQRKALVARTETVVLKKGAILKLFLQPGSNAPKDATLFAQISNGEETDTNFWSRPEPGVVMTRRLSTGSQTIRAILLRTNGEAWFSDVTNVTAVLGRTNDLGVSLNPGVTVRGNLDETVPRPVKKGRVVAHVWPSGLLPKNSPPEWHAWTTNREDGSFEFTSLPPGDLELVALCQGFVSISGPGTRGFRYPQKHLLGTNGLTVTIDMEPTARLEVLVTDDKGNPLKDATVSTWPNVRYGDWAARVLMGDLYNMSDRFLKPTKLEPLWHKPVPDLSAITDKSGLAVFSNLPADVKEFSVEHPMFELPAITGWGGGKQRWSAITLTAGETNHAAARLEPRDHSPITHY